MSVLWRTRTFLKKKSTNGVKTILILIITMHPAAVHTNIERVLSFGVVRTTRIPGICDPNGRCVEIVNEGSALGCLCVKGESSNACGSILTKWGKINKCCKKANDRDDSTNTFWEVSLDKEEVMAQECATDPCEPSEYCIVCRHRMCSNTNHRSKEKKFSNSECEKGM